MTSYINSPPARDIWLRALPALAGVKNGEFLTIARLREAFGLDGGQKLREVLAAGERDGLLEIDRNAGTYRATLALQHLLTVGREDWSN